MADNNKYKEILKKTACYGVASFNFLLAKETGVFSTLMRADRPLTHADIAKETQLKDRYTQEILGCLSATGLVHVASTETGVSIYHLENAAKEALDNGCDFALPEMNYVKILMTRYDAVKSSAALGTSGAVRYERSFFDLMYEHRMKLSDENLPLILESVPGLRKKLEKGIHVIEFGCGSACTLIALAQMFPNSRFLATDIGTDSINTLRQQNGHIPNIGFDVVDLYAIPDTDERYDWLYVNDVIHDLPRPVDAMHGMKTLMKNTNSVCTILEPGGLGGHCHNAGDIFSAFLYTMSTFCCIPESFQSEHSEAYGLGMGVDTVVSVCKAAGFQVRVVPLPFRKALYINRLEDFPGHHAVGELVGSPRP